MDELVALIRSYQIPFGTEAAMQSAIERILKEAGLKFQREHVFGPRDRIDFLIGRIGLECKVDMSKARVASQLLRYAERPEIDALLLVTSRHTHTFAQTELGGKPFKVIRVINL